MEEVEGGMHHPAPRWLDHGFQVLAVELDDGGRLALAGVTTCRPRWVDPIDARRKDQNRPRKPAQPQAGKVAPEEQPDTCSGVVVEV